MVVTVTDNGPGIRPGQEKEIFDKFTRGVRESAIAGVGLGLAICKAIVEAHGGSIKARTERGRVRRLTTPNRLAMSNRFCATQTISAAGRLVAKPRGRRCGRISAGERS